MLSRVHKADLFRLEIGKKRDILSEKRVSGMALKSVSLRPKTGNVDTYDIQRKKNSSTFNKHHSSICGATVIHYIAGSC